MEIYVEWVGLFKDEIKVNNCKIEIRIFDNKETCKLLRMEIHVEWDELIMDEINVNNCKI